MSILERAIEEEPTEIFIRQEIPFDLDLVGSLLSDIRDNLIACSSQGGHTLFHPQAQLPQLKVTKLDDITSCLDLLRDYIVSWSRDLSTRGSKLVEENKSLKVSDQKVFLVEPYLHNKDIMK